jgi:hypothetical protein
MQILIILSLFANAFAFSVDAFITAHSTFADVVYANTGSAFTARS